MRFLQLNDPFKDQQPQITFTKELSKPLHSEKPPKWNSKPLSDGEIDFSDIKLNIDFEDELLETAYADFKRFMAVMGIQESSDGKEFIIRRGETECFEAYTIKVEREKCELIAKDTEGIRRALVYVEDEMLRRNGTRLPLGEIKRKPHITARVSRCYFTPASHVAIEELENELCDEVDYYPDEYLNRLAHDGINALWLGATLQYLVKSDIIPEYGKDADKRMKKLNAVIEKCKRYGIKTYLFSVDPASTYKNDKLLKGHPELLSDEKSWIFHLCPSTDGGLAYIKEAVTRVFTNAPGLAGYINLSIGEAESHCASTNKLRCKRCQQKFGSLANTLTFVEKTIADTMAEVAPHAEYVSWTYAQRNWAPEDIEEACRKRDKKVRHLVNFEDLGRVKQLGKDRLAYDYWLSYVGPGQLFEDCIKVNKEVGVSTWAKIQVCSSHEISTVPYLPAPALLYEKYKYMYENAVHGVMQCWFFGNYPCLMNKAAGELAFEPFFEKKEDFLRHLAGIYWGDDADAIASAWNSFTEGYKNFPVAVDFEWYSPMQDSPCAPYHLKPIDLPMPATWTLDDMVGSDRMGDCILNSHTLDEVIELVETMSKKWNEGLSLMEKISHSNYKERSEQYNVVKATSLIFESGLNTLKFYKLRRLLGIQKGDANSLLDEMEAIVKREIEISNALIPMCEQDNRIGYHSEAHGYKIFPKKLSWRIEEMKKLLDTEFTEVRERVKNNLVALTFYYGLENQARRYEIKTSDIENAVAVPFVKQDGGEDPTTTISISEKNGKYTVRFTMLDKGDTLRIDPEFNMFHRSAPLLFSDGKLIINENTGYSLFGEKVDEMRAKFDFKYSEDENSEVYEISFEKKSFLMEDGEPFRLMAKRSGHHENVLAPDDRIFSKLVVGTYSPDAFFFIIPKFN